MYVDGLPAEIHGLPAPNPQKWIPPAGTGPVTGQLWDSALDELRGPANVPYEQQPYYPNVSALAPFPQAGGPYLIYLDVWQREVTFLENPDLVEKAVGVDTTGRLQTVWQVKWLDVSSVPGVNCSTPDSSLPAAWQQLLLPPGARLTTGIVQSTQSGPCCLTPNTGYTGLENQLYRVEIHRRGIPFSGAGVPPAGGAPSGTATFKWSRDNASVATAVNVITGGTTLTVASTGKDKVLRFSPNDWVEITDDWLELNGLPGELHQVASVNDAASTITLNSAVSPSSFPVNGTGQTDPARHTRLVRWDQRGKVFEADGTTVWVDLDLAGSSGDIPVPPPGTTLILENGITVTFGLDKNGGPHDTGDHWEFAARTADGTVEYLNAAPPRGIYHHYARLAVIGLSTVKLAATGTLTLQDQSQPPIPFLTFQATNTAGWPANFGVATRANALNPANFDLQVVYNPATGRGVTPPVVVETFTNLSLDPAAINFAPNVLKGSTLISVPSFTPPSAKPVFAASFSATPTPFPASGTFQLNDTSTPPVRFLTLQVNPPAAWPPNFAVSATPAATAGNFNLEIVYVAQGGSFLRDPRALHESGAEYRGQPGHFAVHYRPGVADYGAILQSDPHRPQRLPDLLAPVHHADASRPACQSHQLGERRCHAGRRISAGPADHPRRSAACQHRLGFHHDRDSGNAAAKLPGSPDQPDPRVCGQPDSKHRFRRDRVETARGHCLSHVRECGPASRAGEIDGPRHLGPARHHAGLSGWTGLRRAHCKSIRRFHHVTGASVRQRRARQRL